MHVCMYVMYIYRDEIICNPKFQTQKSVGKLRKLCKLLKQKSFLIPRAMRYLYTFSLLFPLSFLKKKQRSEEIGGNFKVLINSVRQCIYM